MLTVYIVFLCISGIIMALNLSNVFHLHFEDSNADLDPAMSIDAHVDNNTSIDAIEAHNEKNLFVYLTTFILRFSFYFSLGFGTIGVVATCLHQPPGIVFVVSVIVGIATVKIAEFVSKYFAQTVGSAINDKVFIGQSAIVLITIYNDQIGQININYNDRIYTRYAKLTKEKQDLNIKKDTSVKIISINNNNEFIVDTI